MIEKEKQFGRKMFPQQTVLTLRTGTQPRSSTFLACQGPGFSHQGYKERRKLLKSKQGSTVRGKLGCINNAPSSAGEVEEGAMSTTQMGLLVCLSSGPHTDHPQSMAAQLLASTPVMGASPSVSQTHGSTRNCQHWAATAEVGVHRG